jgi:hypothetical protein
MRRRRIGWGLFISRPSLGGADNLLDVAMVHRLEVRVAIEVFVNIGTGVILLLIGRVSCTWMLMVITIAWDNRTTRIDRTTRIASGRRRGRRRSSIFSIILLLILRIKIFWGHVTNPLRISSRLLDSLRSQSSSMRIIWRKWRMNRISIHV